MLRLFVVSFCLVAMNLVSFAEDKKTAKVEGTFIIPKEVADIKGQTVEIQLYKYDARIAGKAADLVDKVEIKEFKHENGKETKKEFTIGAKSDLDEKASYYITFFIVDGKNRTHMGEGEHAPKNLCKVLTGGNPAKITVNVRPVK